MRVLDCKNESCQEQLVDVPVITDHLCEECSSHFEELKLSLKAFDIDYEIDHKIVRGLDYYVKTAFEIISENIGSQSTVCGGGRYDGLVEEVGGPKIPGVGFGLGIERLILTLEAEGAFFPEPDHFDAFLIILGEKAKYSGLGIVNELRKEGIAVDFDHLERSLKAQFRYADKVNASYTIILGEDELEKNSVNLKNMKTGEQTAVDINSIATVLKEKLGGN